MNCKIDYELLTEGVLELVKKDIYATYDKNNTLTFDNNKIDLENLLYERVTDEYKLLIDFKNEMCELEVSECGKLKFDIECRINYTGKIINMEYNFNDEKKVINIDMKEVIK